MVEKRWYKLRSRYCVFCITPINNWAWEFIRLKPRENGAMKKLIYIYLFSSCLIVGMELPKSRYLKILKSQSNSSITYHGYKTNRKWYEVQKNLVAGTYAGRLMMYLRIGENFRFKGRFFHPKRQSVILCRCELKEPLKIANCSMECQKG